MSDGMQVVSSESREEERLRRIMSGQQNQPAKKWSPQTSTPDSKSSASGFGQSESKLSAQAKAIKTAITTAERELLQARNKISQHESTIADYERKIEQEKLQLVNTQQRVSSIEAAIREKNAELDSLNDSIAEEENKEKEREREKEQKQLEIARLKQEQETKLREQQTITSPRADVISESYKPDTGFKDSIVSVSSFAARFQQPKEEVITPKKIPSAKFGGDSSAEKSELDKEMERLNRTISKEGAPSKPVKVVTTPIPKPVSVEKKVEVSKGPTFLETLMEREGTPRTFRWETWDALDTVHLVGTFTNWQLLELPRVKGVFTITLPIPSGVHFYRYKVNNKFELEKGGNKAMAPDGEYGTRFEV